MEETIRELKVSWSSEAEIQYYDILLTSLTSSSPLHVAMLALTMKFLSIARPSW